MRGVVIAAGVLLALGVAGASSASAQVTQPASGVHVTISVLAGEQRFTLSPDASGEAAIDVPDGTPVVVAAAIEGNLTTLGQWNLAIGPANGRGFSIGCNAPCTSTQLNVEGRAGERYAARAVLSSRNRALAASPVVSVTWGNVGKASTAVPMPERGEPAPLWAMGAVVTIGALLIAALVPMALGRRR